LKALDRQPDRVARIPEPDPVACDKRESAIITIAKNRGMRIGTKMKQDALWVWIK